MNTNEQIQRLPLAQVHPSPTNPRKHFDQAALNELAESIKARGILQPLIVRQNGKPNCYEIVCGERRYRAANLAKLDEVPCVIRTVSSAEIAIYQIVENLQREGLDALEEAEGYQVLHGKHGCSADQIARHIGKCRSYVYARLKLLSLPEFIKVSIRDGKIAPSTALLLTHIPDREKQKRAYCEVIRGADHPDLCEPMSERRADDWIRKHYAVSLKGSIFDPANRNLSPKAGSCTDCPYRSGNQKRYNPDIKAPDMCTNPPCYFEKDSLSRRSAAGTGKKGSNHQTYGAEEVNKSGSPNGTGGHEDSKSSGGSSSETAQFTITGASDAKTAHLSSELLRATAAPDLSTWRVLLQLLVRSCDHRVRCLLPHCGIHLPSTQRWREALVDYLAPCQNESLVRKLLCDVLIRQGLTWRRPKRSADSLPPKFVSDFLREKRKATH